MVSLTAGSWAPLPKTHYHQVYFSAGEQKLIKCMQSSNNVTIGECVTKEDASQQLFLGHLGKGNHLCPHLKLNDVAEIFVHARRQIDMDSNSSSSNDEANGIGNGSSIPEVGLRETGRRTLPSSPSLTPLPVAVAALCALENRSLAFVGDSVMEQLFQAFYLELDRYTNLPPHESFPHLSPESGKYAVHSVTLLPKTIVNCSRPEAIQWWGCLDSIARVEVFGKCMNREVRSEVAFFKQYLYAEYDMEYLLKYDVVFAWFSFHYHLKLDKNGEHVGLNSHTFGQDMIPLLERLGKHSLRGPGKISIVRESTLQHFASQDSGEYSPAPFDACGPHSNESIPDWFDATVQEVMSKLSIRNIVENEEARPGECGALYVLPSHDMFLSRWNWHIAPPNRMVSNPDCTHYCWIPTLYHPIWERLKLILLHSRKESGFIHDENKNQMFDRCNFTQTPPPPAPQVDEERRHLL
eukprot:CAMPEP_0196572284 /NCGR_PEP_ID=MMETSP1081-20130531/2365_1 /TAXON_ID=36882 /ORGANISM="Pyramimonas amylifera, Strain CCMP720" /LENGTH=465 /DNA_ID=CAMNT_0041889557 /DNA_START=304 /DNA_END=1701 /DNA_ORIENTATION=+